jgi:hypothetical protein
MALAAAYALVVVYMRLPLLVIIDSALGTVGIAGTRYTSAAEVGDLVVDFDT